MTADARIAALRIQVGRLDREDVQRISLPLPDATRQATLGRAIAAAREAGRDELLAETRRTMLHEAFVRYDRSLLRPTWLGILNWGLSSGTAADRVAVAAALDEAAVLAVTEDLLAEPDIDVLGWAPEQLFAAIAADTDPGSLAHALPNAPVGRAATFAASLGGLVVGAGAIVAPFVAAAALAARRRRR